jgi:hypothetical protein
LNPPDDLRFTIADFKKAENKMTLHAIRNPWAAHARLGARPGLECDDRSPLSDWQTCMPVPKRGHARALHAKPA